MLICILRKNIKDIIKEYSSDNKKAKKPINFYLISEKLEKHKSYITRMTENSPIKTVQEIFDTLKKYLPIFNKLCEDYKIESHSLLGYDYFKNKDFLKTHNDK